MKISNKSGGPHRGVERRSGDDRRQVDKGPPGRIERRKRVEARRPEVSVLELTDSEWATLSGDGTTAPPPAGPDLPRA